MEYRKLGKFQLEKSLASGGMGEVIRSVDDSGRVFALKKILKEHQDNAHFRDLFKREAEITFALDHPNIVKAHGFDRVGRQLVLALEFLDGINLRQLLKQVYDEKKVIPLSIAIEIARKILKGLHYAHSRRDRLGRNLGIVHRDLNPSNIFVTFSGEIKILDFGISKATERSVHDLTPKGEMRGKLSYLAPEQLKDGNLDARVDIFAAGIVLWELITAKPMFAKETAEETFEEILSGKYRSISEFRPDCPKAIQEILDEAMRVDRRQRFKTAGEFEQRLAEVARQSFTSHCSTAQISVYVKSLMGNFKPVDSLEQAYLGLVMMSLPGKEKMGFMVVSQLAQEYSTSPGIQFVFIKAMLQLGRKRDALKLLRRLARSDSVSEEVHQLLEWIGVRREPVIRFLRRSNPLNHVLGKVRHQVLGPTPFQAEFSAA